MFQELVNDIGHHVALNGEYSIEFANDGIFLLIFIRFWRGEHLCRVFLKRTERTQGQASGSEPLVQHSANSGVEATMTTVSDSEKEQFTIQPPFPSFDDSENGLNTDTKSSRQVGSTLAEALLLPSTTLLPQGESEYSDVSASDRFPMENQIPPLGGRSRALIKEYFAGNEVSNLPKGHPTIVFTEEQIKSVVRAVADETARASYDMLENLIVISQL